MGLLFSVLVSQGFPPKSKFSVDQIPDLTGRVVLVTGMYAFPRARARVPE